MLGTPQLTAKKAMKFTEKTIAGIQIIGSIALALSCAVELYRTPQAHNALSIALYIIFFVYSAAALYFGIALWQAKSSARRPSAIVWAFQIPFVISNPISYGIVTGLGFLLKINSTSQTTAVSFDFALVERHMFYIFGQTGIFAIGINIFAIVFVYRLWVRDSHEEKPA